MSKLINFTEIEVYTSIEKTESQIIDISSQIANLLYLKGFGPFNKSLIEKIIEVKGNILFSNEEYEYMYSIFLENLKTFILDGIERSINEL